MSKVSKIDQIHLRAVMLCMSKTSKMYIKGGVDLYKYKRSKQCRRCRR